MKARESLATIAVRETFTQFPRPDFIMAPQTDVLPSNAAEAVTAPQRPSGEGLGHLVRRILSKVTDTANAFWSLRNCTSVGAGSRVKGRVRVENRGSIVIGKRFNLSGRWVPCELVTGAAGQIQIGQEVWINYGTVISALRRVTIGSGSSIGQHCIIADCDYADIESSANLPPPAEIHIGDNAWIASRVTIRPGVSIGSGSVVIAGSIVESDVPADVVAGGIPARVLSKVAHKNSTAHQLTDTESTPQQPAATTSPAASTSPTSAGLHTPLARAEPAAPALHGNLIADFTIDELAKELLRTDAHPAVGASVAPYDQVVQTLLASAPPDAQDFAVVWTRPERAVPSFAKLLAFESIESASWEAEVDDFCRRIEHAAATYRFVFVPTWTLPHWERGLGIADARKGGIGATLAAMNLRLMQRLESTPNVFVLNASRWSQSAGAHAMNPKAWYLGKLAFAQPVLAEAANDIRAALSALTAGPRKLIIVDLDNTLWGGIVGDVGWEHITLGEVDGNGQAFVDFQKGLKDLKRRGAVLAIVSKNEEDVALAAIRNHPAMVLRESDFVGWRINWADKARNILELTQELNLGLQSVVFIDDNPVERARVREALPEVYVPEWPGEEYAYIGALRALRCFDTPALSREDLERTRMYEEERKREALKREVGSVDEWLKGLEIKVSAAPMDSSSAVRAAQLLNKTNQLNLSTRRLTEAELVKWAAESHRKFYVISVADRLGDAGLTGLLGLQFEAGVAHIIDFVLSCRVMGRSIEEAMTHIAVATAVQHRASTVVAKYLPTAKNKPCLAFWQRSGFTPQADGTFSWTADRPYALPEAITLDWQR